MQQVTIQSPWYLCPTDLIQKTEVAHHLLGEREFIRTEAVTEMLNQCRTAYYKDTGGPPRSDSTDRSVGSDECCFFLDAFGEQKVWDIAEISKLTLGMFRA